jgi:hypothetical protein
MRHETERRARRVPLALPVSVAGIAARSENIGEAGMFVASPVTLEPGTDVDCEVYLDGEYRPLRGRVAWVRPANGVPSGMGIELVDLTDSQAKMLKAAVDAAGDGHAVQVWLDGVAEAVTGRAEIVDGAVHLRIALPFLSRGGPVAFAPVEDPSDRHAGRVACVWIEAVPGKPAVVELEMARRRPKPTPLPGEGDVDLESLSAEAAPLITPADAERTAPVRFNVAPLTEAPAGAASWIFLALAVIALIGVGAWSLRDQRPPPAPVPAPLPAAATAAPSELEPELEPVPLLPQAQPEPDPLELPPPETDPESAPAPAPEPAAAPDPVPPATAITAPVIPAAAPEVVAHNTGVEVRIPIRGAGATIAHYPLAEPDGVALNLTGGHAQAAPGTYSIGRGGVTHIWIREPHGGAQQIRIFFSPQREARVESSRDLVRVLVPAS